MCTQNLSSKSKDTKRFDVNKLQIGWQVHLCGKPPDVIPKDRIRGMRIR